MFLKKEWRKLILESAIYIVTCAQGRQKREGVRWFRRTRANRFFFGVFFFFGGGWGVHLPQALSQVVTALRAQLSNYDGTSPLLRVGIKNAARRPTSPVNREHRADIPMAH